jgi:uncharacterized protein (DUF885 family)
VPTFAELSRQFLDNEYSESPVKASALGLTRFDDQLDDLSESAFARRTRATGEWLERFEGVHPSTLSLDEEIDRDLIIATLRGREIMDDWEVWRRQPDTYLNPVLYGVFTLFLHRLRPEGELVPAAASRLRGLVGNLADARRNLRPELIPEIFIERARNQALAGATYARDLLPPEVADGRLRAALAEAGEEAATAFESYAAFLDQIRPQARGDWAIGEERYTRLLRERELLEVDTRALRDRGRVEYELLATELTRCARELRGTDDWTAVLHELNRDHPATPEEMRAAYERWTMAAREFLRERRLVSFPPGEECHVVPSPHFQRPVLAVASYMSPPEFSDSVLGHFFVPFPPAGATDEEVAKRLESNCFAGIPTTSVHEAYPGHHWQLVMSRSAPSEVRHVLRTPYFVEGWALYAERMMREQGFLSDLRHEMFQYEATIFRAARIVADTSLHTGEMGYDEAVAYMMSASNLTEPTAKSEVTRYCSWPTQASSYLTGCLEIVRLRDRYLSARGASLTDADALRDFHDTLASTGGGLPIALLERVAMRGIESPV